MADLYRSVEARERIQGWCRSRLEAWECSHETVLVDTGSGPIHVLKAGAGPLRLAYLPGTNFNAATSLAFIRCLQEKAQVFVVDLPGQPGLSSPNRPPRSTGLRPSWLSEALDEIGTNGSGQLALIGHSRGAAEALCAPPDAADALVLLNPAGLARPTLTRALLQATLPWLLRPSPARSDKMLHLMSAPGYEPAPDQVEWLTMVARDTRTTGAPGPVPQACTDGWRSRPVSVLCGERDVFFPPGKVLPVARERLDASVEELSGVGHLSVEEAPERVADHIFRFFDVHL